MLSLNVIVTTSVEIDVAQANEVAVRESCQFSDCICAMNHAFEPSVFTENITWIFNDVYRSDTYVEHELLNLPSVTSQISVTISVDYK